MKPADEGTRRIVVTGMGMVTPLACGVGPTWKKLIDGQSGIRTVTGFDASDLASKVAGQVPRGEGDGLFNPDDWVEPKDQRKMDHFIVFAMAAAIEAVRDSGWEPEDEAARERTGVIIGSGIGGLPGICAGAITLYEKGPRRLSPFFIPSCLINLASGNVSIRFGFKGPNHSVVTACSTGAHAIGDAARLIRYGDADVMIAGGAEGAVCRVGAGGSGGGEVTGGGRRVRPERPCGAPSVRRADASHSLACRRSCRAGTPRAPLEGGSRRPACRR